MREIQASEAKTHLPQLLDGIERGENIERGESIIMTRHGRAIARLIPGDAMRREGQAEAVERLKPLRSTMPRVPLDELMAMRHGGHRQLMPSVVDASVVGSWMLPDENQPEALAALERLKDDEAFAPSLLWFELRNLLLANERRQRSKPALTAAVRAEKR